MDKERHFAIKKLLKNTWHPFFQRFGKFTQVQLEAIPKVVAGRNLFLCAPTASGKTEAILAPVVECLKGNNWKNLSVLYVVPTRALVNDLVSRIEGPLTALNIRLGVHTGDVRKFNKKEIRAQILITTPESLDSLLCRVPHAFEHLQAIILDELHLLDKTPRGDQLRILIERIKRLGKQSINYYALSATVKDPVDMGMRYFHDFDVVVVPDNRKIIFTCEQFTPDYFVNYIFDRLKVGIFKKIIIFCNSRIDVEELANILRKSRLRNYTCVHHASLARSVRHEAENIIKTKEIAICVATMTLELGIDIGTIDHIILYKPPLTITSLLQRIGRGNRRSNKISVTGFYTNEWERLFFNTLFASALKGAIYELPYGISLSVAVQQILSYVCQKEKVGTSKKAIKKILEPLDLQSSEIDEILDYLITKGYLDLVGKYYLPSKKLSDLFFRGKIHANLSSQFNEFTVVDQFGKKIGVLLEKVPTFALNGRMWQVSKIVGNTIYAVPGESQASFPLIRRATGYWDYIFGEKIKKRFFPDFKPTSIPYADLEDTRYYFHFHGVLYGLFLRGIFKKLTNKKFSELEGLVIKTSSKELIDFGEVKEDKLEEIFEEKIWKYIVDMGGFFKDLPPTLTGRAMWSKLNVNVYLDYLKKCEFVPFDEAPAEDILITLGLRQSVRE